MAELVGAVDQGTTSTRFVVFDHEGQEIARHQLEHHQLLGEPGWVEHDPTEIWETTSAVIDTALRSASLRPTDLVAIGITNQRETAVVWERATGRPVMPAIVWQDTRTDTRVAALVSDGLGPVVRERTGLPLSTYPSATKLEWILDHVPQARRRAARGELLFGTIDSWLVWCLTGEHVTDVTNASRTMLMDLRTLDWDPELLEIFGVPREMLAEIQPSTCALGTFVARDVGATRGAVSISGILGDQQAAMVGHGCFTPGDTKNTYGTGNFLLVNTGTEPLRSSSGLITTVCYQFADCAPIYALEGSIAVTGSAVQWLRDQLGIIERAEDSETLAASVADSDGVYFVPAFSGLFAPHWRSDARGTIVGLVRSHTGGHIARATLEAIGYQSRDVLRAAESDLGHAITELHVDGGVTANALCMQLQADILGIPVLRASYPETTARGAAFAAGLGASFWEDTDDLPVDDDALGRRWYPTWSDAERAARCEGWSRAIERSLNWTGTENP